jgi:hypothetical protein
LPGLARDSVVPNFTVKTPCPSKSVFTVKMEFEVAT